MKKSPLQAAFTLIELLTVICIIGILAGVSMPVYKNAIMSGKQTAALNGALQIAMGLRLFANDNDGVYPNTTNSYNQPIVTSNDAFRSLVPNYIDNEKVFTVPGSKAGPSADNVITPVAQILVPGENYWAYIEGLNTTSNSNWPLVVDSTDGTGYYNTQQNQLGGTWQGTKAVCVNTDGSGHLIPLKGTGNQLYIPSYNDPTQNALAIANYMGTGMTLLEPAN